MNKQRRPVVRVQFDDGSVMFDPLEEWRERERRQKEVVGYLTADERARAAHDAIRTAKSAKTRRKRAKKHWSIKWLKAAHQANPKFGARRLALAARKMVAEKRPKISAKKRDEIDYRAREYLKAIRKKSGDV